MVRKKYKHNTKSLRRYKKNELKKFVKDNNLPLKINYKMTKTEIVSALLKLQRNGYSQCFCKLEMKAPRKLTEKQQQNIRKLQQRNQEKLLKVKNVVQEEQKIDKKRDPPAPPIRVNQGDTELEKVKNEMSGFPPSFEDFLDLDGLFNKANKMDDDVMTENLQWVENEIFGKPPIFKRRPRTARKIDMDFFEKELEKKQQEEQKEEQKEEIPEEIESMIQETAGRVDVDFTEKVAKLTIKQLQDILEEAGIQEPKNKNKQYYINVVSANKTQTNQLVEQKLKEKEQKKQQKKQQKTKQ